MLLQTHAEDAARRIEAFCTDIEPIDGRAVDFDLY